MKKLIALLTSMFLLSMMLASCSSYGTSSPQNFRYDISDSGLCLVVETDKAIYEYDDYIYVTAILINVTDGSISPEAKTFFVPTSTKYSHQELSTTIEKDGNKLIDVDMYLMQFTGDETHFVLNPGEKYVQNMRFSTRHFSAQFGDDVMLQLSPPCGIYIGTVTAVEISENTYMPHSLQFQVEIKPESRGLK